MDINGVIIIKFIVTYYCPSACSIHRYGEAVVHAPRLKPRLLLSNHCHVEYIDLVQVLARRLKPRLLLSNHCHIEYINLARVLFVVLEGY